LFYVEQNQKGASYPAISDNEVKNYKIAIPPLSEQTRIVKILDKFDKLTSSLTDGLPKEIELRQKQYDYWREQLLSFQQ
jgi:type I restriction enzyme S subunit